MEIGKLHHLMKDLGQPYCVKVMEPRESKCKEKGGLLYNAMKMMITRQGRGPGLAGL